MSCKSEAESGIFALNKAQIHDFVRKSLDSLGRLFDFCLE